MQNLLFWSKNYHIQNWQWGVAMFPDKISPVLLQQLPRFNREAAKPRSGWGSKPVKNRLVNYIIPDLLLHWLGIPQLATQWLLPASPGTSKAALDGPYQEESVWKSTFWNRTNINQACRSWFLVNFRNVGGVSLLHSWVSWDCLLKARCPPTSFTACREEEGTSRKWIALFVCLIVCLTTRRS